MYERFTDRARKVMQLAQQEARRFNHEYIGTEHILLGLVKESGGVAATILKNLDVDLRKIRLEVEKIMHTGPDMVTMGKLPHTPRAKRVIEYAICASREMGNNHVGTEHLMIGLLRDKEGVAYQVLSKLGVVEDAFKDMEMILGKKIDHAEQEEIKRLMNEKEKAVAEQDFMRALELRDQIEKLQYNLKKEEDAEESLKIDLKRIACALFLHYTGELETKDAMQQIRQITNHL